MPLRASRTLSHTHIKALHRVWAVIETKGLTIKLAQFRFDSVGSRYPLVTISHEWRTRVPDRAGGVGKIKKENTFRLELANPLSKGFPPGFDVFETVGAEDIIKRAFLEVA